MSIDGLDDYWYGYGTPADSCAVRSPLPDDFFQKTVCIPLATPGGATPASEFSYLSRYSEILLPLNPDSTSSKCYYVNGISNTVGECIGNANALLETLGGDANVIPAYDQSFGFFEDLFSVYKSTHKKNYQSSFSLLFQDQLRCDIQELEANQDPRKIFIFAFSRGAASVYHTVRTFSAEERDHLIIIGCGPIMPLTRDLGFKVINLVSTADNCSLYLYNKKLKEEKTTTYFLPKKDGLRIVGDHSFQSRTYQRGIENYAADLYKEFGSCNENQFIFQ